jgi:hypothetical protein
MPDMDIALKDAMQIDGSIGAALVDYNSGMDCSSNRPCARSGRTSPWPGASYG